MNKARIEALKEFALKNGIKVYKYTAKYKKYKAFVIDCNGEIIGFPQYILQNEYEIRFANEYEREEITLK
jgi:hypothetical protein